MSAQRAVPSERGICRGNLFPRPKASQQQRAAGAHARASRPVVRRADACGRRAGAWTRCALRKSDADDGTVAARTDVSHPTRRDRPALARGQPHRPACGDAPGDINADPMGKGWIFKIKLASPADLDSLMDQAAYDAFVKSLG